MFNRIRNRKTGSSNRRSRKLTIRRFAAKGPHFERLEGRELMAIDLSAM